MRDHGHTGLQNRPEVLRVEIGQPQVTHLAGPPQIVEPGHGVESAGDVVVPPVQLHQIDGLHAQSAA